MSTRTVFVTNQPITLKWRAPTGTSFTQRALLQNVSESMLLIYFAYEGTYGPLPVGTAVSIEAPDANGAWLAQFRGTVTKFRGRQLEVHLDGAMEVVQRRAHPRAHLPFSFHSAVLLGPDTRPTRFFLAHPVDISVGGVRLLHRLPLSVDQRFRLHLRARGGITVAPIGCVLESKPVEPTPGHAYAVTTYVTRSRFEDTSSSYQQFLSRYVNKLLAEGM